MHILNRFRSMIMMILYSNNFMIEIRNEMYAKKSNKREIIYIIKCTDIILLSSLFIFQTSQHNHEIGVSSM